MFRPIVVEDEEYQIKPMNCPFHCLIFKDLPRSYRDLPVRWAELGTVYRYERSGTLHGLFRVRGFTQDDAHIFCLPTQLQDEIVGVLNLVERVLNKFGFRKFDIMLSTKPEGHVGSDEIWEKATNALVGALNEKGLKYNVDEGGGAFYGPKIDIKIQDAIGRRWQCSTIQCDFNLPERFQLEYTATEGTKERPIMVHRAIFGSLERFFGVLIENTAGDFPLWLSPVHLRLLPVIDDVLDYCKEIKMKADAMGLRVEIDTSGTRLPKMIRNSEKEKIPVTAVIGMKEKETNHIAIRLRKIGEADSLDLDVLLNSLKMAIDQNLELNQVNTFIPKQKTETKVDDKYE
jgi:threonyl-tRNA synthetase